MPADHINISHPDNFSAYERAYRESLEMQKLQTELKHLACFHEMACRNLEAIFTRIERGDEAELHYPDGRVFIVTGQERE